MPIQPDPTHPKFLEGDDVLPAREDDVSGHVQSGRVDEPSTESEGAESGITEDEETDDVEGHLRTR